MHLNNADKVLLFVMEACRPDQVESLLEISRRKDRPLGEMAVRIVRNMLNDLPPDMRQEVIEGFREEDGIDVEEIL